MCLKLLYFPPSYQHGMTPLMHAAYKGKVDMCRLLLRHGADVNCNEHEQGYTALMFAGLSGMLSSFERTRGSYTVQAKVPAQPNCSCWGVVSLLLV